MSEREDLKTELARVYHQEDAAHLLLDKIDFPRARRPAFKTAELFWNQVFHELDNGLIVDGVEKLRAAATDDYPGNRVFNPPVDASAEDDESLPGTGQGLVDDVVVALAHNPIVLLLAQDGRAESHVLRCIVERAGASYGADGAFYVTPPEDFEVSAEEYFASLGRQCGGDRYTVACGAIGWRESGGAQVRRWQDVDPECGATYRLARSHP